MKITSGANCRVALRKHPGGSVLKGTVFNRPENVGTYLNAGSDGPADNLAHRVENAKAGRLIAQQVPLHSRTEVNGVPFYVAGIAGKQINALR